MQVGIGALVVTAGAVGYKIGDISTKAENKANAKFPAYNAFDANKDAFIKTSSAVKKDTVTWKEALDTVATKVSKIIKNK